MSGRDPFILRIYLLDLVSAASSEALQQRMVYEAGEPDGPAMSLLLVEHTPWLSIGREGSRAHIRLTDSQLLAQRLQIEWISRGGGCIYHAPGQLAVYPIVALDRVGWSVGELVRRSCRAMHGAMHRMGVASWSPPGHFGCWGRTGLLAACAMAVRYQVSCYGYYVNVQPPMQPTRLVDTDRSIAEHHTPWNFPQAASSDSQPVPRDRQSAAEPGEKLESSLESHDAALPPPAAPLDRPVRRSMSSLALERGRPYKMSRVRSLIAEAFAAAFEQPRYHIQTGHPYLARCRENTSRAS